MVMILTQNRKNILNGETIDRIYVDGGTIYAQTLGGTEAEVGTYEKPENINKVMNYIAYSFATAGKDGGRTIVIPSEEVVSNDRDIVAQIIKAARAKGKGSATTLVEIAPELKEYLEGLKGGEDK